MRWVAYVPLCSDSQLIAPGKVRHVGGRPLFAWSLEQAISSKCFDEIYVTAESPEISREVSDRFSSAVTVLNYPSPSAEASMETALLEFQQRTAPFDVVCLIHTTFPLMDADDFRAAKSKFLAEDLDSLVTVTKSTRLAWTMSGVPAIHDPVARPQPRWAYPYLIENKAFYLARGGLLTNYGCYVGGRTGIYEMPPGTAAEIDTGAGWLALERLLSKRLSQAGANAFRIKALVLDVDGTMTDGGMYYGPAGEALKKFNTRDAHGLQLLRENGIRIGIISTEKSPAVEARMKKLNIDEYHPGVRNKLPLLLELARRWNIALEDMAYIGDDLGDLECLNRVGTAFCPADSVPEILEHAHHVCKGRGGHGAVREVCDFILKAR
jgi:N-acylneuraminate cytidylyltransferase